MRNGLNNNNILAVLRCVLLSLAISVGPFYKAELRNVEGSFIDFGDSMGTAISIANEAFNEEQAVEISTEEPEPSEEVAVIPEELDDEIEIVIKGEDLFCGGKLATIKELKQCVDNGGYDGKSILLMDDYAEMNVYKKVKEILDERIDNNYLTNRDRLRYQEEQIDE